jgi:hypothetical protein
VFADGRVVVGAVLVGAVGTVVSVVAGDDAANGDEDAARTATWVTGLVPAPEMPIATSAASDSANADRTTAVNGRRSGTIRGLTLAPGSPGAPDVSAARYFRAHGDGVIPARADAASPIAAECGP